MTTGLKIETPKTRKVLGRGLASLLPEINDINTNTRGLAEDNTLLPEKKYFMCPIELLSPCSTQPRQQFDDEKLIELAESIKENGIIQPLIVRTRGSRYEIIAGERRWRASKIAGLSNVPVLVKDLSDKLALQAALVENIQRADLNSVEEAKAYKQLIDDFTMTQDDVSKKVGKDRSSITNYLRLLKLPLDIQEEIINGNLTMGHARALCSIEDENLIFKAASYIIEKKLSVRETETFIKKIIQDGWQDKEVDEAKDTKENQMLFCQYEDTLRERFGTKVQIKGKYEKGKFVIEYFNKDDFDRILGELCTKHQ